MLVDRLLYFALLFLLPTQLAKFFFLESLLISGRRIDYVAISIYLTEILLVLMILTFLKRTGFPKIGKPKKTIIFLVGIILLSVVLSANPYAGFIKVLKIIELFLFALYIYYSRPSFSKSISILIISGIFTCVLAWVQFYLQHSLGGLMYLLGERAFSISTPNIARSVINGRLILRPYATFPHPNVLASFLSLLLPFALFRLYKSKKTLKYITISILFILTLIITMSRSAIGIGYVSFLILSVYLIKQFPLKKNIFILLVSTFTLILLVPLNYYRTVSLFSSVDTSLTQRVLLTKVSLSMISTNPLTGVGVNNFLFALPPQIILQPVHNTYLLILAESGIAGFILFIFILYKTWKNIAHQKGIIKILLNIIFFQILLFLSTDHYFYTLWQGQLLFTFFIAFMINKKTIYV